MRDNVKNQLLKQGPDQKMASEMKTYFSEKEIQMANKYMKQFSAALVI